MTEKPDTNQLLCCLYEEECPITPHNHLVSDGAITVGRKYLLEGVRVPCRAMIHDGQRCENTYENTKRCSLCYGLGWTPEENAWVWIGAVAYAEMHTNEDDGFYACVYIADRQKAGVAKNRVSRQEAFYAALESALRSQAVNEKEARERVKENK